MSAGVTLNLSRAKVLVIDDNPMAMEILSQILLGFGVTLADKCRSCEEAESLIQTKTYNLIIVDEIMPDQDGFHLANRIRSDPKGANFTAPIIMTSANPTEFAIRRARDTGLNFVVAKPLVPGALLARIHWIAVNSRAFVASDTYRGPDRRFHTSPLPKDTPERRSVVLQLMASSDRALSQDEINTLF